MGGFPGLPRAPPARRDLVLLGLAAQGLGKGARGSRPAEDTRPAVKPKPSRPAFSRVAMM